MAWGPVAALAALKLALHLAVNAVTPYGFHRDELLYLGMGRHLRLWAMDFPPGIALAAEAVRAVLGDSLLAIRLVPAIAGTLLLLLAALIARELGGGRRAQALAALGVLSSPLFLRSANLFQPVVLDQLAWTVALYALVRLCREPAPRWWAVLGAALGAGLLTKFSIVFIGLAILLAILVTKQRAWLLTPWPWLAAVLALAIGSPSLVGQFRLDFPVLGQMADLRSSQLEQVTPLGFLSAQLLWGPATLVALIGLIALLVTPALKPYRVAGWACAWALLILIVLRGKPYYAGPVYPALLAAGAVVLERMRHPRWGPLVRWGAAATLVLFMAVLLPIGVPILPPAAMARYALAIGATEALRTNTGETEHLPQDFADMLGWEEQVRAVADVYGSLPAADREQAVLLAANYGEAGALDFFGPRYGLPPVVSPAGSYWFFGPGERPGDVVLTVGVERRDLERTFASVEAGGRVTSPWSVAEERDLTIFVARGPHRTLQEIWPSLAGRN
ncbi:MAG: glycosyltransferase family 39 protein [Gemmatimonadota bacterium]|nr:glycosyltransferase family 39 protein [Gemmatimonadota bacterium]